MQNGARPCILPACTRVTLGTKWNPRSISALSSPMFASPRSALGLRRSLVRSKNLGKESPGTGTRPGQTDRHYKCHPSQHKHRSSHLSHVTRVHVSVYCAHPPRVQHGSHNGPADAAQFPLETVLKYTCYPGYLAVGFAHAKCFLYNTTAQWFGPDLTCKRKSLASAESDSVMRSSQTFQQ